MRRPPPTPLERARLGDDAAFDELTAPHVRELHLHCYRMLGSLVDAEDLLQETLLAAWRGLDGFAGRSSFRAWLYRIATNQCLNAIRTSKRRRPPEPAPPFVPPPPSRRSEVTWLQPYPDDRLEQAPEQAPGPEARYLAREATELAFVAALQRMPPRQTAALLLHDVLGYSTTEVAVMLDSGATAIKGALQRARASLARSPSRSGASDPHREHAIAQRFAAAFAAHDVDGLVDLLTDDAWLAMPPAPHEYHGRDAVVAFLTASAEWRGERRMRLVPTGANTQPAFGCYLTDPDGTGADPAGVVVLTVVDEGVGAVVRFLDPALHRLFGLADALDPPRPEPV